MVRRHAKLTAVLVVVMLALTGFSSSHTTGKGGRGGKSRSGSGGGDGGGGCSNSKKSNGGYRDYDNDDYSSSGSSGSSGSDSYTSSPTPTPTDSATAAARAYVVDCVKKARGKRKADTSATVKVVAEGSGSHRYEVDVVFLDAAGDVVDRGYTEVTLDGGETRTVQVRMQSPKSVARVTKCQADELLSRSGD
ncbi:hypothetical protein ACFYW6_19405 [Streptomyces sp. NPDC002659]|uniref:hypothetical protein n=1 Tax=Streptomyces sp. NPDC002659 TaxID=3364656 RepID=UPI0036ACA44B